MRCWTAPRMASAIAAGGSGRATSSCSGARVCQTEAQGAAERDDAKSLPLAHGSGQGDAGREPCSTGIGAQPCHPTAPARPYGPRRVAPVPDHVEEVVEVPPPAQCVCGRAVDTERRWSSSIRPIPQDPIAPPDIVEGERRNLAHPDPKLRQTQRDGMVAPACRRAAVEGGPQAPKLACRQRAGQVRALPARDRRHRMHQRRGHLAPQLDEAQQAPYRARDHLGPSRV